MGKATRLSFFLLLPVLLLGLVSCQTETRLPVLVVTVQDHVTEEVVQGAGCRLPEVSTYSDRSGRCRFESWSTENVLTVTAAGYQLAEVSLAGIAVSSEQLEVATRVALLPDRVKGIVLDAYDLRAIARAVVHTSHGKTVQADQDGLFTVLDPVFPMSVTVQAPGYDLAQGTFFSTTVRILLRPNTLEGQILDRYDQKPIAGAVVTLIGSGPVSTTTDAEGRYFLEETPETFLLQVEAPRYHPEEISLERTIYQDVHLRPTFLHGLVRDGQSGQPISQTRVVWEGSVIHTDARGRFSLEDVPAEVVLQVLSPGFAKRVITVTESSSVTVDLEPFATQGIYVTSFVASTFGAEYGDLFTPLLDFVEQTELNAMVIEAKDAWGTVAYDSQVPLVQELGTASPRYNVAEIIKECHRRGIYTIAYIVTFEDSWLIDARPEWGVQSVSRGGPWIDNRGLHWSDPYRQEVWEYNIAIARELAELGFDEIQFDYIRFPTDGNLNDIRYVEETSVEKQYDTITAFVQRAYEELTPSGVFVSADVFGYAAWRKMWEQGQDLSRMTHFLDYICPMAYPSHYSPGEMGCPNPNACPYEIVLETLNRAFAQMTEGQRAKLRPWLQDFDLGDPPYGPVQIEAEIRAAWDGGGSGWLLWNAGNYYTQGVDYSPQEEVP